MSVTDFFKVSNFHIILKDQFSTELTVQQANIPGITIGTLDMNFQAMHDKRPGDSIEFGDLQIRCHVDEDLKSYMEILKYLFRFTHDPDTNVLSVDPCIFDATMLLTTNKNNLQHTIRFHDAWIKSIGDIEVTNASTQDENTTMDLVIPFVYFDFE
jgi:hypothetical protein